MKTFFHWLGWTFLVLLLAFIILPWLIPTPQLDGKIPEHPFPDSRFVAVQGVDLHLRERWPEGSDQPVVILLHGFGGSSYSWRYTLDALEAAGYPVIAVDLPPFGYSARRSDGPLWPELVDDLMNEIAPDQQRIVIGHSMGAGVAARLQQRAPDSVQQAILVAGIPRMREREAQRWLWLLDWPLMARWLDVIAGRTMVREERIGESLESAFGRPPSEQELAGYLHPLTIPGTYAPLLQRLSRESADPPIGWQGNQAQLVWGEQDAWVPISLAEQLIGRHPDLPLVRMPEVGHNPMDTDAEDFNRILLNLIQPSQGHNSDDESLGPG